MNINAAGGPRRGLKASELVAREIVNFIIEGGYSAGDMLPREQVMQEQFRVGRGSLREALRLLEVQGLITIKPGVAGGPVLADIRQMTLGRTLSLFFSMAKASYEDVSDALLILAPLIARRATRNADRELVRATLEQSLTLGECEGGTVAESVKFAAQFHRVLSELNGNPILSIVTNSLGDLFNEHVVVMSDASGILPHCRRDHREIAEAVIARDSDAAAELSHDHMKRLIDFHRGQAPAIFSQPVQWR